MHKAAQKKTQVKPAKVAAPKTKKVVKKQQQKRTFTKKAAKKVTTASSSSLSSSSKSSNISMVSTPLVNMTRRRFANLQKPDQMNPTDAEKYNQMMPSTSTAEQWEQQLEILNSDVNGKDQSVSTEVEEFLAEHADTPNLWSSPAAVQYNIFKEDPQFEISKRLIGPPGTMAEPTMVFSPKPYRIVGCVGTVDNPHPLGWFSMEGYLKHMCPDCGQIFQLTNNPDECDFTFTDKVDNMAHFGGH